MKIKKDPLTIRAATAQDAGLLCQWWNDGQVMAHAGFPNGLGITEGEIVALLANDNQLRRRLIIAVDDLPVGEMSFGTPRDRVAEIGIKICDPSQQNKGYGSEYLKMLMQYLFMELGYDRVILDTNLKNERAQRVYERLGFRKVATRIDSWKNQLGELQSSVDYEITKAEYLRIYGDAGRSD